MRKLIIVLWILYSLIVFDSRFKIIFSQEKLQTYKDNFMGPELGLTVVLNSTTSDDFYTLFNLNGFLVKHTYFSHDPLYE